MVVDSPFFPTCFLQLVKQTVMTNVYGVTFVGARQQIENRLKEKKDIVPENKIFSASTYVAKLVQHP